MSRVSFLLVAALTVVAHIASGGGDSRLGAERAPLQTIVDRLLPLAEQGEHPVSLAVVRQALYGLGQDVLIQSLPVTRETLHLSEQERHLLNLINTKAQEGRPLYQYLLAGIYHTGSGVDKSLKKSIDYWTLAANQGYGPAHFSLGKVYYNKADYVDAMIHLELAAHKGIPGANHMIGCFFYNGLYGEKRKEEALDYWRKDAELGFAQAQYNLGLHIARKYYRTREADEGLQWLRRAGEQGHVLALDHLYICNNGEYTELFRLAERYYASAPYTDKPAALEHLRAAGKIFTINEGHNFRFVREMTLARHLFDEVRVDDFFPNGEIHKVTLNRFGCGIDGIRFMVDYGNRGLADLIAMIYAVPENADVSVYIVPMSLICQYALDTQERFDLEDVPWPDHYLARTRIFRNADLVRGKEYIACFIFDSDKPMDIYYGFSQCPDKDEYRRENNGSIVRVVHAAPKVVRVGAKVEPCTSRNDLTAAAFGLGVQRSKEYVLNEAVKNRDLKEIKRLARDGSDINKAFALAVSVRGKFDPKITKWLLENGANPNGRDKRGLTALHALCNGVSNNSPYNESVDRKSADIVKLLISSGASPNHYSGRGFTPLMLVSMTKGYPLTITQLIQSGAMTTPVSKQDMSALDYAKKSGATLNIQALKGKKEVTP